jgi:hypothetical protein
MAINPGTDLLSDALIAAEPQRTKAAEERLAQMASQGDSAGAGFEEALASPSSAAAPSKLFAGPGGLEIGAIHPVKSGNPYQQFEVTVLKSLFELMLPEKANSVFGSGFAGNVWRSMLAQSLADVAGHTGGIGIARDLQARRQKSKPAAQSRNS